MSSIATATSAAPIQLSPLDDSESTGGDAMAEFLATMQALAQSQLDLSSTRIHDKRSDLDEALEDFLKKLADAAAKAQEDDDGGGLFGDLMGAIGDAVGALVGTIADFVVDAIELPVEAGIAVAKNLDDPTAMMQALQSNVMALGQNGAVADDVRGFTKGVVRFGADLAEWTAKFGVDRLTNLATGKNPAMISNGDLAPLWGSLKKNILDNPHFWAVTAAAAKAGALAASAMSGGALFPIAVGLLVALELDKKTGFIEKAVGPKAAPWVRLGLETAAGLCMLGAGGSATVATLRTLSGVASGGALLYQGYTTLRNANEQADQLEEQADLTAALNRAQALQRMISTLVEQLKSDSEDKTATQELGASLMQAQAAANAAAIIPA